MVLGLIDFLLGGKKNTQVPRNAQVASPIAGTGAVNQAGVANVPNGVNNQTENVNNSAQGGDLQFQDSNPNNATAADNMQQARVNPVGGKKSVSQVLGKITSDIKEISDNVINISTEMKEIQNNISSMEHRLGELEGANKVKDEKLSEIDDNMGKFLSLYEVVNNQYNPFVSLDEPVKPKEIIVDSTGSSADSLAEDNKSLKDKLEELESPGSTSTNTEEKVESSLLELDTIDLDSAAADAVPLNHLKSNTNSLVVILSWLEYLVKKAGINETKKTLTYYTETLKWITPEVYFELDKFLRGMEDVEGNKQDKLNVRDHIVSLYFISKLNEKKLDEKLTKAVLQIIKEK